MQRCILFVTRAKDNIARRLKRRLPKGSNRRSVKGHYARRDYPGILRRITALVGWYARRAPVRLEAILSIFFKCPSKFVSNRSAGNETERAYGRDP